MLLQIRSLRSKGFCLTPDVMNFVFNNPTRLLFGVGKLGELHNEELPGKKALLLLSCGQSVHKNGSYDKTVEDLKMSEYGFDKSECMTLAVNARETMGGLYAANPCEVTDEDIAGIFERSFR